MGPYKNKRNINALLISLILVGCGGENGSDAKLPPSSGSNNGTESRTSLSGVALDGYLYKANVCLDKNDNATCDAGDGRIVQTDKQGKYQLELTENADGITLLVEAVQGVTIDMDTPDQPVSKSFVLEIPSSNSAVVSPLTATIASLAETTGTTYTQAAEKLAKDLNVATDVITSDYVSQTSTQSREVHMLARSITKVLQEAQTITDGEEVSQKHARQGSIQRLATLDLVDMKSRTDRISAGADNTDEALEQIAKDFEDDVKIKPEDIHEGEIVNIPQAPTGGIVNDSSDTFDWNYVLPHEKIADYQYSLDNGQTWDTAESKPINVGSADIAVGAVQVRVIAKPDQLLGAGKILKSAAAYTETRVPAAPASLTVNDANNQFDWINTPSFTQLADYEYSTDGGENWQTVAAKPQSVADEVFAIGDIKIRVKANAALGQPEGLSAQSTQAMTITPPAPVAPILSRTDDNADILVWNYVTGFDSASDYEIDLGSGWQTATANPYQVGDINIAADTIKVRVKSDPITGRPAGAILVVATEFTKEKDKPTSPTNPSVNDADNLFGWDNAAGYDEANRYQYSVDGGLNYQDVTANPQPIEDQDFAIGAVCVRVKEDGETETGSALCSDKVFTATPAQPAAPTNGVINDALNTFNWDWVAGFTSIRQYELSIDSGEWKTVTEKPITLEDRAYDVGSIKIRVAKDAVTGRLAGRELENAKALTKQPSAPTAPTLERADDNANTLAWNYVIGFDSASDYEINLGSAWVAATANPYQIGDVNIAADTIKIRVKSDTTTGRPAGALLIVDTEFTVTPEQPVAPTLSQADDNNDILVWNYVTGFDSAADYEIDLGSGWKTASANPYQIGDVNIAADTIKIRVKSDSNTGRPAGAVLLIATEFTKAKNKPTAPTQPLVNDANNLFGWKNATGYDESNRYQYSVDGGLTYQDVTANPQPIEDKNFNIGDICVRVKGDSETETGSALCSNKVFTATPEQPAAPTNAVVNDALNTFDWNWVAGFTSVAQYEQSIDSGEWQAVTEKPIRLEDRAYSIGAIKVRVMRDPITGRSAGRELQNAQALTKQPDAPAAPTLNRADDNTNTLAWNNVTGFTSVSDYEINLGSGWITASANPYQIGDVNIAANTIKIRVKSDPKTGRPVGSALVVDKAFTYTPPQPIAPTLNRVDDNANILAWNYVTGFDSASDYEIDLGSGWQAATANPYQIGDVNIAANTIKIRVKSDSSTGRPAGAVLVVGIEFTVTPDQPKAPTNPVVDDALNTFDWTWVTGFTSASKYEMSIDAGEWKAVTAKPIQLEDRAYSIGAIKIRVVHDPVTGRPAGQELQNTQALTEQPDAPIAPTNLVADDTANTLDWSFVSGFDAFSFYEWSLDSGSNWSSVTEKPINVGDIAKSAGEIQLRVKANGQNGMPAGAAVATSTDFNRTPSLPAPASGTLTNAASIQNNGFGWATVTAEIEGTSVAFDQPSHYEFTVDKGATWHTASTNPQFVGPQAYDKESVGVRIKQNAIAGKTNLAGETLWATDISGQFIAIKYVPMISYDQVAPLSTSTFSGNGWNTFSMNCIAEYDDEGKGEAIFWAEYKSKYYMDKDEVLAQVDGLTNCGINHWQLPTKAEATTLSVRSSSSLPSHLSSYLINDSHRLWVNDAGTLLAYQNGAQLSSPSSYTSVYSFPKWQLADSASLVSKVDADLSAIKGHITTQTNELDSAKSFLTSWIDEDQNKTKTYALLATEAENKHNALSAMKTAWQTEKEAADKKLSNYLFEAKLANERSDTTSRSFIAKVAEYQAQVTLLQENNTALAATIEASSFANKLALMQQRSDALTSADTALSNASSGAQIHQATLAFYNALAVIEKEYASVDGLKTALNNASDSLANRFAELAALLTTLSSDMTTLATVHDTEAKHTTAVDGLNRAHTAGYVVSESDALIDGRFAKLDVLGRYLPQATSYAQGWRCVLDTSITGKQRVWSLLKDGMPNGKDEVIYDATGTDNASLLGSNGYLETAKNQNYCGFNDWVVPHLAQLSTLATATVSGVSSKTLDSAVFPNHRGLAAEYDKSHYNNGIRFYYWSNVSNTSYTDRNYAMHFATTNNYQSTDSFYTDRDNGDDKVLLARLVRQNATSWQYLDASGNNVSDRASAKCVKDTESGDIWQLFQNADTSERYKKYSDINTAVTDWNSANTCGKSNWKLPTSTELLGLIPNDDVIFPYMKVPSSSYNHNEEYLHDATNSSRIHHVDMNTGELDDAYNSSFSSSQYLYRLIAK